MVKPYFTDGTVELYHGDFREVVPQLQYSFDLVVADPPYGETALKWDVWPDGWPAFVADYTQAMWCFGSMRMFLDHAHEIQPYWNLSQDIVWKKTQGTGLQTDRFRRVHEFATHWYRGPWGEIYHDTPRDKWFGIDNGRREKGGSKGAHLGKARSRKYEDDGTRLARSVIEAPSVRGGISKTQKPVSILEDLIHYGCPVGGVVLDPFAGSASTLIAGRHLGRRVIGVELDEEQCEKAATRLSQGAFDLGGV